MGVNTMGTNVNELIVSYQPMLSAVVDKLVDSGRVRLTSVYDKEELLSIGYQVLWNLLYTTNDNRSIGTRKLADGIIKEIRLENPNALCLPSNEFETTRLGEAYGIHDTTDYSESINIVHFEILNTLDMLSPREEMVIMLRNGFIDGCFRTLDEVAAELGVTRERIRQIEAKALRKLRHPSRSKKIRDCLDGYDTSIMYDSGSVDERMNECRKRYEMLKEDSPKQKTVIHKTIRKVTTVIEEVEERIEITTESCEKPIKDMIANPTPTTYDEFYELSGYHPIAHDIVDILDGVYRNKYDMCKKIMSRARDVNAYYKDPVVHKRFKKTLDKCEECVKNVIIPNITKDTLDMADYMRCSHKKFSAFIHDLIYLNIGSLVLYDLFGELSDTHPEVKEFKRRIYHYAKRCNMPYITRHFVCRDSEFLFDINEDDYHVILDMNSFESMKTKSIATQHMSK